MTKNPLFEFDKNIFYQCEMTNKNFNLSSLKMRHCEEGQSPDVAIQNNDLDCFAKARNDIIVIGTDEAGRGPGAGGVFASAVYFPNPDKELIKNLAKLNDSKKLSKKTREDLYDVILQNTINSTVCIEVEEIEKINILNASLKAMKLACENVIEKMRRCEDAKMHSGLDLAIRQKNILVLVDGNKLIKDFNHTTIQLFDLSTAIHQKCIVKGDSKSASIAAASILAKVTRDRYMQELHEKYPQYNWAKNAGYLTREHLDAIEKYGITPHHRKSFLKKQFEKQLSLLS